MKNKLISEIYKKRLQQLAGMLKENGQFNNVNEPIMTHNQFRDYSKPSEDDEQGFNTPNELSIVIEELKKQYKVHFSNKSNDTYILYVSKTPLHYLSLSQSGQELVINEYDQMNGNVEKFRDSINPDDLEWGKLFDFFQDFLSNNSNIQEDNDKKTNIENYHYDVLPNNIKSLVQKGLVTYRGLNMERPGWKIRINKKEYIISDETFDELNAIKKIRFHAPFRTEIPGEEIWKD